MLNDDLYEIISFLFLNIEKIYDTSSQILVLTIIKNGGYVCVRGFDRKTKKLKCLIVKTKKLKCLIV